MSDSFAALQVKPGETPHEVIGQFMVAAAKRRIKFKSLEILSHMALGSRDFVRFRTDLESLEWLPESGLVDGRAFIAVNGNASYSLHLPGGREGRVDAAMMQATAGYNQHKVYRGPAVKLWKRQFIS
jgi:hypothetical protein